MASPEPPTLRSTWITVRSSSDDSDEPAARHHRVVCRRGLHACRVLLPSMSRSLNVNVAPGSRSVGFSLGCARPRPTSLHPSNDPGPQLGRHIPSFGRTAISQAAKTYVVLEHSCEWSFPAITPFGWEAPVDPPWRGLLMQAMVAPCYARAAGETPRAHRKG